jgi:hypothetical protein
VPTPRESAGEDPGTDYAEDEDGDMGDPSPGTRPPLTLSRGSGMFTFCTLHSSYRPFSLLETNTWQGI